MCGIIAGICADDISPVLFEGLKRVEYRGYDSAGFATIADGKIEIRKDVGRVPDLEGALQVSRMQGKIGMAHTRWATHGGVTKENAHPQMSCGGLVAVVHNGIIENYLELKEALVAQGHTFTSETDTEVIAHLIESLYRTDRDPVRATRLAASRLKGQYAIVVMFADRKDVLTGARNDAPLILGVGRNELFLASDVLAFISRTDKAVFLDNMEVVELTGLGYRVFDLHGREVKNTQVTQLAWELADVSKHDYAHFTLKEIHEQPESIRSAMAQDPESMREVASMIREAGSVILTASGSSYHAALVLKSRLNREAKIRCEAILAGEFDTESHLVDERTVLVAFSQSGETADLLDAVRAAKRNGARVIAIVNAFGSTLARLSDATLPLNCGPEVGVAATKSFTSQVMVGNLIVDALLGKDTLGSPGLVEGMVKLALGSEEKVKRIASLLRDKSDFYFIARGALYPIAQEGALKLKELSYIHAEGMPASELKHGTLALIERGTPVVVIARGEDASFESTMSNAMELQARGAEVIGVTDKEHPVFRHVVMLPKTNASIAPIVEVVPLQLLAYFMATERENDPDYPRNLAKSVTVR
jgi:glucosamine--fructose-6-phosphate aminotransferase (isomerizing)